MLKKFFVPFLVSVAFIVFTLLLSGSVVYAGIPALIDIPSFVISIVVPYVLATVVFGMKGTRAAYRSPFDPVAGRVELAKARAYFKALTRYIACWALFAIVAGFIGLLINAAQNTAVIGLNIAVCILSALYAAVIPILFIIPFRSAIDERLAETD